MGALLLALVFAASLAGFCALAITVSISFAASCPIMSLNWLTTCISAAFDPKANPTIATTRIRRGASDRMV